MQISHDYEQQVISAVRDFARSIKAGGKVVADMSSLVEVTNMLPLANFEYWERLLRSEFDRALDSRVKANWKLWDRPSQILTWLDLISWDGYKREKTLRTLIGGAPNSFFFSLALRRLNDWVPQVRDAAREKLPLIVERSCPHDIAEALSVVLPNWNTWGRIQEEDKAILLEIISKADIGDELKKKIISSSSGPMSYVLSQICRTPVLDESLDEIAANAIQPSVRARAYRNQFDSRVTWLEGRKFEWTDIRFCKGRVKPVIGERRINVEKGFKELLEDSSNDASSIVRRVAAEFLIRELENMGDESLQFANKFCSDKSAAVAERGRFALKRLKEVAL